MASCAVTDKYFKECKTAMFELLAELDDEVCILNRTVNRSMFDVQNADTLEQLMDISTKFDNCLDDFARKFKHIEIDM